MSCSGRIGNCRARRGGGERSSCKLNQRNQSAAPGWVPSAHCRGALEPRLVPFLPDGCSQAPSPTPTPKPRQLPRSSGAGRRTPTRRQGKFGAERDLPDRFRGAGRALRGGLPGGGGGAWRLPAAQLEVSPAAGLCSRGSARRELRPASARAGAALSGPARPPARAAAKRGGGGLWGAGGRDWRS